MQTPEEIIVASWWLKALLYASFAALGGLLGHIMRAFDKKERIIWIRAILEGISAGFAGVLMMLTCNAFGLSEQWTGIIVGVTGWLGAQATIRLLEQLVYKKLAINNHEHNRRDDPK